MFSCLLFTALFTIISIISVTILKLQMGLVLFLDKFSSREFIRGYPFFYVYCACMLKQNHSEQRPGGRGGGRNSSVGSAWARCPQCSGFDPPLGTFSVEGIFPLELTWVQAPFPQTPDESINRGLVCAHMHFIARTQKILTFMS